jgi:hypothetical protein
VAVVVTELGRRVSRSRGAHAADRAGAFSPRRPRRVAVRNRIVRHQSSPSSSSVSSLSLLQRARRRRRRCGVASPLRVRAGSLVGGHFARDRRCDDERYVAAGLCPVARAATVKMGRLVQDRRRRESPRMHWLLPRVAGRPVVGVVPRSIRDCLRRCGSESVCCALSLAYECARKGEVVGVGCQTHLAQSCEHGQGIRAVLEVIAAGVHPRGSRRPCRRRCCATCPSASRACAKRWRAGCAYASASPWRLPWSACGSGKAHTTVWRCRWRSPAPTAACPATASNPAWASPLAREGRRKGRCTLQRARGMETSRER